jgi:hypothetical protein
MLILGNRAPRSSAFQPMIRKEGESPIIERRKRGARSSSASRKKNGWGGEERRFTCQNKGASESPRRCPVGRKTGLEKRGVRPLWHLCPGSGKFPFMRRTRDEGRNMHAVGAAIRLGPPPLCGCGCCHSFNLSGSLVLVPVDAHRHLCIRRPAGLMGEFMRKLGGSFFRSTWDGPNSDFAIERVCGGHRQ